MNTSLSVEDVSKLKVQELKKELKARELPIGGNKTELVNRLIDALRSSDADDSLAEAEALLEDNEADDADELVAEEPEEGAAGDVAVEEPVTETDVEPKEETESKGADSDDSTLTAEQKRLARAERFGITCDDDAKAKRAARFGIVSDEDKKAMRAAKFNLSTEVSNEEATAKKAKRAERFGITVETKTSAAESKPMTEEMRQKLLKRKERFGEVTSSVVNKVETDEKLKQRAARFGALTPSAKSAEDEEKQKKRLERFGA